MQVLKANHTVVDVVDPANVPIDPTDGRTGQDGHRAKEAHQEARKTGVIENAPVKGKMIICVKKYDRYIFHIRKKKITYKTKLFQFFFEIRCLHKNVFEMVNSCIWSLLSPFSFSLGETLFIMCA